MDNLVNEVNKVNEVADLSWERMQIKYELEGLILLPTLCNTFWTDFYLSSKFIVFNIHDYWCRLTLKTAYNCSSSFCSNRQVSTPMDLTAFLLILSSRPLLVSEEK